MQACQDLLCQACCAFVVLMTYAQEGMFCSSQQAPSLCVRAIGWHACMDLHHVLALAAPFAF